MGVMKANSLDRRLVPEKDPEKKELVPISFQWTDKSGMLSGPLIKRMVPKSRFGWVG